MNDLSKEIEICENRNGDGGHRLLKSDAVGQVFEQRLQDSDQIDTNDTMGRAVLGNRVRCSQTPRHHRDAIHFVRAPAFDNF